MKILQKKKRYSIGRKNKQKSFSTGLGLVGTIDTGTVKVGT